VHRDPLAGSSAMRRALAAAALAAALAAAPPAEAQRGDLAPRTAPLVAARPAIAAATAVPLPPPPAGAAPKPGRVGWLAVSAGPWAGFDLGQSAALHVDYGFLRTPPGWRRAQLEVRLSVMVARPSEDTDLTRVITPAFGSPVSVYAGVEETRVWAVEVVPMARVRLPFGEKFALYADGGVGLAQTIEKYDRQEMYAGHTERTENVTGLVLRLGAGMSFALSPRTRLLFEPVAVSLQLGPDFSAYVPTLGLAYRL